MTVSTDCPFTTDQMAQFQTEGYLILENLLSPDQVAEIIDRLDPLFDTQFETGIYPDEWYGRPGLSQPNATRQMTGMWRCDRTLARYTLSERIAYLNAALMGWTGGRYGLDVCWIKPPRAPALAFHRNNTYASTLDPAALITCWIALSHCTPETGNLEIAPGSHHWHCTDQVRFLHSPREDYRAPLWQAAAATGLSNPPSILPIELSPGSAIFLHGDLWHGSGPNPSETRTRQSLAISTLSDQTQFQPPGTGTGYIFDRYRRRGSLELDESFYPVLWRRDGYRTKFLEEYCG